VFSKHEYSESDLEQALIFELERFLLELGNDFAFVARQKRLRIGTEWYRVDLLFFHRRLRSLLIVELKVGQFTHAAFCRPERKRDDLRVGGVPVLTA
jgi:predicted nuclease of restriction endonuclease-like (RecB) superfamily